MEPVIVENTAFDFVNHLEYAAIKRVVIELKLRDNPGEWKKVFIRKVVARENVFHILTLGGDTIAGTEIMALIPPFEDYDADAISCMCG
ncbi:MAG: hypothetical protein R3C61_09085 [Bacteroidia bacterium]